MTSNNQLFTLNWFLRGPLPFHFQFMYDFDHESILKKVMLADDGSLFIAHLNIDELLQRMNNELKSLPIWFKAEKLSINTDITK